MARLALLLVLQAVLGSTAMAQPSLTLEIGGVQFGVFARMSQDQESGGRVTLEQGWITPEFLDLWWPELSEGLTSGPHHFPTECVGRRLEVTQALPGTRGRLRSWTLVDACPLACEVEARDGERISVTRLILRVKGVGAVL